MDSSFISQVDSIRFLNYNNCNENVKLYIDDVKFGVWSEEEKEPIVDPSDDKPEDKGCSCSGNILTETILLTTVALCMAGAVLLKKRKGGKNCFSGILSASR